MTTPANPPRLAVAIRTEAPPLALQFAPAPQVPAGFVPAVPTPPAPTEMAEDPLAYYILAKS